jgi:hypothetical protein
MNQALAGGVLIPAVRPPVRLTVPGNVVYSIQDYGPRKHARRWFKPLSYAYAVIAGLSDDIRDLEA